MIGRIHWREDVLHESGADYLMIQVSNLAPDLSPAHPPQHRDLCQILLDAATKAGVHFEFHLTVSSVQSDPRRPRVILSNGRTMTAHVIIGADGPRSVVRKAVDSPTEETLEGHSIYVYVP